MECRDFNLGWNCYAESSEDEVFIIFIYHLFQRCFSFVLSSSSLWCHYIFIVASLHTSQESPRFLSMCEILQGLYFNHHHRAFYQVCAVMFFVVWQAIRCLIWWHYQKTHRSSNNLIVKWLVAACSSIQLLLSCKKLSKKKTKKKWSVNVWNMKSGNFGKGSITSSSTDSFITTTDVE